METYNVNKLIKNIYFIIQTTWIFFSELCLYFYTKNYKLFIRNFTKKLASVNILYVKIFQSIALNTSIIDNTIHSELTQFTDHAPYNSDDIDYDTLNNICKEHEFVFKNGFNNPDNSGMISLVYLVEDYTNSNSVVIKIKRKNIDEKLEQGIDNLLFLVSLMKIIPLIKDYKICELIEDNIYVIKEQTNFCKEITNMKRMQQNCRNLNYVKIPTLYDEINNKYANIIAMEYIKGYKFEEVEKQDFIDFGKQVIKFGIVTTIIHGFSHGDFHIGNIVFIKEKKTNDDGYSYKLGILDFGIMTEIKDAFKRKILICLTSLFQDPPIVFLEHFVNSGIFSPSIISDVIPKNIYNQILEKNVCIVEDLLYMKKHINQTTLFELFKKIYMSLDSNDNKEYKLSNYGIKLSDDLIKIQLSLAMANSVTLTLCQDKIIHLTNSVVNDLFHIDLFTQE